MTGTNFSSWFRADEGTLYADAKAIVSGVSASILIQMDSGDSDNRYLFINSNATSSSTLYLVTANVVAQASIATTAFTGNDKTASAYAVNDFAVSLNGANVQTDSSGVLPVVDRLRIGATSTATTNGTIKKLAYYPRRLTNAELQGLTTV
jgi:hypothetical protein